MSSLLSTRWRIAGGHKILHRRFSDHCVIYHSGSGDTHLVDGVSFNVLDILNEGVYTFEGLLKKLMAEFDVDSNSQLREYLTSLLYEFQKLAIVERLDL